MEDIAVHIAPKDAFHCLFNGIDLIGAHDHQDRFRLLDNKVTSKQFGDIELCEKILCEVNEPVDSLILLVSPIEDKDLRMLWSVAPSSVRSFMLAKYFVCVELETTKTWI